MVKLKNENRPFKVRKNGKTRGRSSRAEKTIKRLLELYWEHNKAKLERFQRDLMLYGYAQIDPKDLVIK